MAKKQSAGRLPPGAQTILVNPGTLCSNCNSPLAGVGYQRPREKREGKVICAGCLAFLATMTPKPTEDKS